MPDSLTPILARLPLFAHQTDLVITELSGGLTNRNYKIETGGVIYVLRVGGNDTNLLGIDRQIEYGCTLAAARVGVAPEPVAFLQPEGYLVTRFVAGVGLPAETIGSAYNIRRVVQSIQRFHALDQFPGSFSPFRVVNTYLPLAQKFKAPLPANIAEYVALAREIEVAFLSQPHPLVACHNDLLNGNFIDDGQSIRILDWEYGGLGDRFFDLANFAAQHDFKLEQDKILLGEYFGAFTPAQFARYQLMKIMSDMREAMWALVQCNVSQIEFDYLGYAQKYFNRINATFASPNYANWLAEVTA